jgi:DNA-binding GntR family transcriptional regulator
MDSLFKAKQTPVMKPFREVVYDYLREAIVQGDLPQGHRFKDSDLATRFGVSRMPVREALQRLEAEGLIEQTPMKGYCVVNLSQQDVAHIFSIRKSLEGLAAEYACRHITHGEISELKDIIAQGRAIFAEKPESLLEDYVALTRRFNRKFIDACRVPHLIHLVWTQRELLERFHIIPKILDRCGETLIDDRQTLLEALENRDAALARNVWEAHLDISMRAYFDSVGWPEGLDYI